MLMLTFSIYLCTQVLAGSELINCSRADVRLTVYQPTCNDYQSNDDIKKAYLYPPRKYCTRLSHDLGQNCSVVGLRLAGCSSRPSSSSSSVTLSLFETEWCDDVNASSEAELYTNVVPMTANFQSG